MTKHKLDNEIEDILQHYGIKGMKWRTNRSGEKADSSETIAGGGGESDESRLDEEDDKKKSAVKDVKKKLGKATKDVKKKLGDVSKDAKKKGKSLITKVLGKGKPTYKVAKPNAQLTKQYREALKKTSLSKSDTKAIEKAKNDAKIRGERATNSNKKTDAILDKYKKQGYKKHEKSKKTLAERGYTFRADSKK